MSYENSTNRKIIYEISKLVSEISGIQLGERQSGMVENRLRTRLLKLKIKDFDEYSEYLHRNKESELKSLVSLLTTHHTYFFREFSHFEFLINQGLKFSIQEARKRKDKKIKIWSAASSKGQEVYSLAMFLNFHLSIMAPDLDFIIYGTDIDPESISYAQNGVYKYEELKQAPAMYVKNNWIRGSGEISEFVKIKNELKRKCSFQVLNLLNLDDFLNDKTFDLIFCRNVFIYFNSIQIKSITSKLIRHLDSSGYLFIGVSESLNGLNLPLYSEGVSIYRHVENKNSLVKTRVNNETVNAPKNEISLKSTSEKLLEVLCVDDSKSIHSILEKILCTENGFKVKTHVYNGIEAIQAIQNNRYDVITLDMHMPELDGLGFLEKTQLSDRPPVVILSSVNRDDPSIAQRALSLGAFDYIEKPSLNNMNQAVNEITSKLRLAYNWSKNKNQLVSEVKSKSVQDQKIKVLIIDDSKSIRSVLSNLISENSKMEVIAETGNPLEVEDLILKHQPDVLTLDLHMPEMDGVELLKILQPKFKIPTIIVSSISQEEGPLVLKALELGALDYVQKPTADNKDEVSKILQHKIETAVVSNKKMINHLSSKIKQLNLEKNQKYKKPAEGVVLSDKIILLGASTGGTEAIREVLECLPKEIPPILIVQHIPAVFSAAFADRLNSLFEFTVKEAVHREVISKNHVYIAPGGKQMGIKKEGDKYLLIINDDPPMNRHRPSVDYMFNSASTFKEKLSVAVILTGMGNDGARSMKKLRDLGIKTIAQDEESSVVFGMPKSAIELGAADFVLPLNKIAQKIIEISSSSIKKKSA